VKTETSLSSGINFRYIENNGLATGLFVVNRENR